MASTERHMKFLIGLSVASFVVCAAVMIGVAAHGEWVATAVVAVGCALSLGSVWVRVRLLRVVRTRRRRA